jgi:hypothetical protein
MDILSALLELLESYRRSEVLERFFRSSNLPGSNLHSEKLKS